jgi:hypothetical protein
VVEKEEFFMIRDLKSKVLSNNIQIAHALDLDRKTVAKWLKSNDLPDYGKRIQSSAKLYDKPWGPGTNGRS